MKLNTLWDLTKLYPSFDSQEFKGDFAKAEELIENSGAWAKTALISTDNAQERLAHIIKTDEALTTILYKMEAFMMLSLATDATNKDALAIRDRLQNTSVDADNTRSLFVRFIGGIDHLDELIDSSEHLKSFAFYLRESADSAKYLLPKEVEPVVAKMEVTGGKAWSNMRDMIDGTMMVRVEQDGEITSQPLPVVRNMADSADREVRKKGYEAELAAYPNIEMPLSHALNAIKGEGNAVCAMRGYDSILDRSLKDSRMTKQILDAMLGAMEDFFPHARRYLKAKAKLLGYKGGLPFFELFAPIGDASTKKYTYEQAHEYLVKTFEGFSPEMSEFIDHAFKNRWIDAVPKEGKGGGAFCENLVMIGESRILSNFTGSFTDISTLAHELGHAWHGHCLKDLPMLKTSYPMPLAETASIFNEGIVIDAALKEADEDEKFTLLEAEIMKNTQIIVDIFSRYLFEADVIETRKDHSMSVDEMKDSMIKAQKATYGNGLDENYMHPYMWACKVHYYLSDFAFYNWPYAFGLLFAKGLFAQYKKVGAGFVEDYKKLLAATGSADVADIASRMGIDVTKKAFWEQSLAQIVQQIDVFCELVDKRSK